MTQLLAKPDQDELSATDLRRLEEEPGLEYVDDHFEEKNVSHSSSRIAGKIIGKFAATPGADGVEIYPTDLCYRCHPKRRK